LRRPEHAEQYGYRADPKVPPFPDDKPIIVFDGHCVLCSRWARFVMRHDRDKRFRLLAAQTALGRALYEHFGLDPVDYETNVLLEDGRAWLKSEGTIRMFERLGFPWSMAAAFRVVPRALRDRLYGIVARNRLRWFGSRATCFVPEPSDADRFIG
jgi:predicted DCC family thiol-disulfide oxidoreductase YuxK